MGPPPELGRLRRADARRPGVRRVRDEPAESEKLLAYQPPLPTNVRGYDGNPVQTFARERRVELAYDEYPPLVINAFISGGRQDLLQPWRSRLSGPCKGGVRLYAASAARSRPAARRSPSRLPNICCRTMNMRSAARSAEMILAFRLEDTLRSSRSSALPQLDFPRPQRLWRAGGEPRLFRQGRCRPDPAGSRLPGGAAQGAEQL